MHIDTRILVWVIIGFVGINGVILVSILFVKLRYKRAYKRRVDLNRQLIEQVLHPIHKQDFIQLLSRRRQTFFNVIKTLSENVQLPQGIKDQIIGMLREKGVEDILLRQLHSPFEVKRMRAAMGLGLFTGRSTENSLLQQLSKEKKYYIKIVIVNSLIDLKAYHAIDGIFLSIIGAPEWYRRKTVSLLKEFGYRFYLYLREKVHEPQEIELLEVEETEEEETTFSNQTVDETAGDGPKETATETDIFSSDEVCSAVVEAADSFPSPELKTYIFNIIEQKNGKLLHRALQIAQRSYPQELNRDEYLNHNKPAVQKASVRALPTSATKETFDKLLELLRRGHLRETVIIALEEFILKKPAYLHSVSNIFYKEKDKEVKEALASVLANKIEYFIANIFSERNRLIKELMFELVTMGKVSSLIGFLNRNKNIEIENELLEVVRNAMNVDPYVKQQCALYLDSRIRVKLSLENLEEGEHKPRIPVTKRDRAILVALLCFVCVIGPGLYAGFHWDSLTSTPIVSHIKGFVIEYNFYFAYYSAAINSIYLIFLLLSGWNLAVQIRFWRIHNVQFLFRESILPSVSILAPAYNEGKTITENVKSLLNLTYPSFHVLIINDGSKDDTLNQLISVFELERVDTDERMQLSCAPIRGVFRNESLPALTVIDKENGGKADSLNAGINYAEGDYICTIDADSLLETDALLKMMYQTLITDKEPLALGGNILPVNGSTVENGEVTRIRLPKSRLARFQTIEYIRAFLAGRLGWAFINCLLIISGAFGVFRRDRVVAGGGYLTGRGRYKQDTVGEDMELVVRLHKTEQENRRPYGIPFSFNANCWTEVPETIRILLRQRDRWHRGLMEILSFHRKMLANPRYKQIGMVSFPYFYIFELIGPFFELFGYLALVLSAIFGLLNATIALLLFVTVIMYGILVSISSLLISENEVLYFSTRETLLILFYAVIENFGFRQIMSMSRAFAYISFLFKTKDWGEMVRKGFSD